MSSLVKAIRIEQNGGPEVLKVVEIEVPAPADNEITIQQHAAGLNFIDIYFRSGLYKHPLPHGLGFEAAGVVTAVKRVARRPVIVKLSPNVSAIEPLAQAADSSGADALSLVNTFIALAIDALLLAVLGYFAKLWVFPAAIAYFVLFHRLLGQTPGKWLLGIRVEDPAGGRISWKAALIRFLVFAWGPLGWTVLGWIGAFIWSLMTPQQPQTIIVQAPAAPQPPPQAPAP